MYEGSRSKIENIKSATFSLVQPGGGGGGRGWVHRRRINTEGKAKGRHYWLGAVLEGRTNYFAARMT